MMFLWVILPILAIVAAAVYLARKISGTVRCFFPGCKKRVQRGVAWPLTAVLVLPALRMYDTWFLVLVHFVVFLLLTDAAAAVIRALRRGKPLSKRWERVYRSGIIAVVLTAALLGYGAYHIYQIQRVEYTVSTEKNVGAEGYTLAVLSDLHYGITMDGAQLQKVADRISAEKADAVILDGDLVDESTTLEEMQEAFKILGGIQSTYGVYYVYGNHDQNNYSRSPNYSKEQLAETIEACGITILEDAAVDLGDGLTLIGRADREGERLDMAQLTEGLDPSREWVVLDHQPTEYAAVEAAGGDLILSGHTHGGQIWPAGLFATLFHFDELNYGEKDVGSLHAIVTSGVAGWGYPIRTERNSEYAVVHIVPNT